MARRLNWAGATLALAVLAGSVSPALALDETERPDLQVELVGLPLAGEQRAVTVRVTNASVWWADETKLTVETVAPTAGNARTFAVENLDPGQSATFTYTLAAPCEGQVVKAQVTAGKNYAGVPESNLANNTIQAQACPPKAQPAPKPQAPPAAQPAPAPKPALGDPVDPGAGMSTNRKRPSSVASLPPPPPGGPVSPASTTLSAERSGGPRTVTREMDLEPSQLRRLSRNSSVEIPRRRILVDSRDPKASDPKVMKVGWDHLAGFRVHQTAVNFDLASLLKIDGVWIQEAHLSLIERPISWGPDVGKRPDQPGCVTEVGLATNNWTVPPREFVSADLLFRDRHLTFKTVPHQPGANEIRSSVRWRGFDVTDHLRNQVAHPDDLKLGLGYVLHGAVEDDRNQPPTGGCSSEIFDVRLWITYSVPTP